MSIYANDATRCWTVVRSRVKRQVDDTTYCRGVQVAIAVVVAAAAALQRTVCQFHGACGVEWDRQYVSRYIVRYAFIPTLMNGTIKCRCDGHLPSWPSNRE
jgi:hypothetical protein